MSQKKTSTKNLRVLITDPIDPEAVALLKKKWTVTQKSRPSKAELIKIIPKYDIVIGRTSTKIDKDVVAAATRLKCIGVVATGWDHIDIDAAAERGIVALGLPPEKILNKEHYARGSFIPTAEHTMLCMLAAAGNFVETVNGMKAHRWEKFGFAGTELFGKTLGIIGLGRIGSLVALRAQAFGMKTIAYDKYLTKTEAAKRGATLVDFKKLLKESDFITIHLHQNADTIGLISTKEFAQMKKDVILINTSRSLVIDEAAFLKTLKTKIRCAVIDVLKGAPDNINWKLVDHPKVIATPHIAGVSKEGQHRTALHVVDSIYKYVEQGDTTYAINVR